jgi:hypothetical protein
MGASGWKYITAHDPDLGAVLARLRQQVFDREYYWPDDPDSDSWDTDWPDTMAEQFANDEVRESGTHSILDITTVIGENDPDTFGTLRPLTSHERHHRFGTATPTRADFDLRQSERQCPHRSSPVGRGTPWSYTTPKARHSRSGSGVSPATDKRRVATEMSSTFRRRLHLTAEACDAVVITAI